MPKLSSFYFSFPTAIGNAYAVLSNANKRRQYDQCGDEKSNPSRQGPAKGNFEPDISPEDLFNMFFGGGYPQSECCLFSSFLDVVFMHPSVNIYFIYLGHANGYTNGRMRNPRRERRERQGDVSSRELPLCRGCDAKAHQQGETPSRCIFRMRGKIAKKKSVESLISLQGGLALFVQVMPILILVIVSALSQIMVNSPPYSLSFRP